MYGKGEYHNKYQELVFMIFAIKMETFFFFLKNQFQCNLQMIRTKTRKSDQVDNQFFFSFVAPSASFMREIKKE